METQARKRAPASALLGLSVLIAAEAPGPLGLRDLAGAAIMAIAILGEGLAAHHFDRDRHVAVARAAQFIADAVIDAGPGGNRPDIPTVGIVAFCGPDPRFRGRHERPPPFRRQGRLSTWRGLCGSLECGGHRRFGIFV